MSFSSNFEPLKADFKRETKLDADTNMALYIQYYGAKMNDLNFQTSNKILQFFIEPPTKIKQ